MGMRARSVVLGFALWLLVVTNVSALAWVVINNAGRVVVAASTNGSAVVAAPDTSGREADLSQPEPASLPATVPTPTPTPTATLTRTPTSTVSQEPSRSSSTPSPVDASPSPRSARVALPAKPSSPAAAPAPPAITPVAEVDRTARVSGGQLGVSCTGARIALRYAQPDDGWSVEVGSSGPEEVEVTFRRTGGTQDETHSTAHCQGGTPTFAQQAETGHESVDETSSERS